MFCFIFFKNYFACSVLFEIKHTLGSIYRLNNYNFLSTFIQSFKYKTLYFFHLLCHFFILVCSISVIYVSSSPLFLFWMLSVDLCLSEYKINSACSFLQFLRKVCSLFLFLILSKDFSKIKSKRHVNCS